LQENIADFVALISGRSVGISGWETENIGQLTLKFLATSFLTLLLSTPVGFFASYGRGIIAPLGFVIITLILAQFMGVSGLGAYFPWAIPGVFSVSETVPGMIVTRVSYVILIITFIGGFAATALWWKHADHH
jgi:ABC-2 type transport system permease protein